MDKEKMKGLQKGFNEAGGMNDPLMKAISDRKKEISKTMSGWFSDKKDEAKKDENTEY